MFSVAKLTEKNT